MISVISQLELESKRRFVKYISHELRTPLNVICLGMQLAIGVVSRMPTSSLVDQLREILYDTNDSSDTVTEILDHLLLFDKVEEGKMDLFVENVPVKKFLLRCLNPFRLQVIRFTPLLILLIKAIGKST